MGQDELKKHRPNLYIYGKRIFLREVQLSDASKNYCDWLNDPEVNKFLESRFEKWSIKKIKIFITNIKKTSNDLFYAIISRDEGKHIGNIKIGPINKNHNYAEVGILIGDKSSWNKGFATEALKLIVDYAFNKLKIHKLNAGIYANNISSIKAFEKAGFLIEGVKKRQYFYNGTYIDCVLVGIINK